MSEIIFDSLLRAGYFSTKESRRDRKINKVLNDNNGTKGHN